MSISLPKANRIISNFSTINEVNKYNERNYIIHQEKSAEYLNRRTKEFIDNSPDDYPTIISKIHNIFHNIQRKNESLFKTSNNINKLMQKFEIFEEKIKRDSNILNYQKNKPEKKQVKRFILVASNNSYKYEQMQQLKLQNIRKAYKNYRVKAYNESLKPIKLSPISNKPFNDWRYKQQYKEKKMNDLHRAQFSNQKGNKKAHSSKQIKKFLPLGIPLIRKDIKSLVNDYTIDKFANTLYLMETKNERGRNWSNQNILSSEEHSKPIIRKKIIENFPFIEQSNKSKLQILLPKNPLKISETGLNKRVKISIPSEINNEWLNTFSKKMSIPFPESPQSQRVTKSPGYSECPQAVGNDSINNRYNCKCFYKEEKLGLIPRGKSFGTPINSTKRPESGSPRPIKTSTKLITSNTLSSNRNNPSYKSIQNFNIHRCITISSFRNKQIIEGFQL